MGLWGGLPSQRACWLPPAPGDGAGGQRVPSTIQVPQEGQEGETGEKSSSSVVGIDFPVLYWLDIMFVLNGQ